MAKENEPNWNHEEPPTGTVNSDKLISYLGRNEIKIRDEGDNICRFARNHKIRFVEIKRSGSFGSNPHVFYLPSKSKIENILKYMVIFTMIIKMIN